MLGIYCIINKINGKRYIGSSNKIERRINHHHKSLLRNNKHWNVYLQSAWNKYGEENFSFDVLEEVSNEDVLLNREQFWMDFYNVTNRNFGYNLALRADRSKPNPESIAKMIQTRGDKYKGENAPMYGKKHTADAKLKIAEAGKRRKGCKLSKTTKEKLSKHFKGKTYEELMGAEKAKERRIKQSRSLEEKYGVEKALEIKRKLSIPLKDKVGDKRAKEIIEARRIANTGKERSKEFKDNCRINKLGILNPMYKIIPHELQNKIVEYYQIHGKITQKAVSQLGISSYLITKILKERGLWKFRS